MELRLAFVLLCLLVGLTNSVPLNDSNKSSSQCSLRCSNDRSKLNYKSGQTYVYSYKSRTRLSVKNDKGPEVELSAQAEITAHSSCEMSLKLKNVELRGLENNSELKKDLEDKPLMFAYNNGKVDSVCSSKDDEEWAVNVKKGIISALQVSMKNLDSKQSLREQDVVGNCDTKYEPKSGSWNGKGIRKSKNMKSCGQRQRSIFSLFPSKYSSSDSAIQTLPMVSSDYNCEILILSKVVSRVKCSENSQVLPTSLSRSKARIETELELEHKDTRESDQGSPSLSNYEQDSLRYNSNPEYEKSDESKVTQILRDICNNVKDEVKPDVPAQFTDLVYSIRPLSYSTTYRIWKNVQDGKVCSSRKLKDIFTDALLMDASEGSVKLISEMIINKEVSSTKANYWMTLLAFANRPTEGAIKAALPLIQKSNTPRQVLLGISSFVHNFCQDEDVDCMQNPTVNEVVRSLTKRVPNQCRETKDNDRDDNIVALRALSNIGDLISSEATNNILECSAEQSNSNAVRVAAIEALEDKACHSQVKQKMSSIFMNRSEDAEVRIAAYKTMVQCASRSDIQEILSRLQQETSKQVGAYVTSHLSNIQESSDPEKRSIQQAIGNQNIPTNKFPKDPRKYSQNVELSYLFEKLNVGVVVEGDIVYDQSFAPRSIKANVTIPLFGNSVNVMEIGVRQEGLEDAIESLARPNGALSKKNVPKIFQEVVDFFTGSDSSSSRSDSSRNDRNQNRRRDQDYDDDDSDDNNSKRQQNENRGNTRGNRSDRRRDNRDDDEEEIFQRRRHPRSASSRPGRLELLRQKASNRSNDSEGTMYVKVDGKYILHLSIDDIATSKEEMKQLVSNLKRNLQNMVKTEKQDRAFSFMPLDSTYEYPATNGLPMKLELNATTVIGYKQNAQGVFPSISTELAVKMGFEVKAASPGILFTSTIHSSPSLQAEVDYKNSLPTRIFVSLPKDRVQIFTYESNVEMVQTNNRRTPLKSNSKQTREHKDCFNSLAKITGLQICSQMKAPKPMMSLRSPIPALNGQTKFEVTLHKSDSSMKGWEYQLELPAHSSSQNSRTYRAKFNTPGSTINREVAAELELESSKQNGRRARVHIKSPFKQVEIAASHKHNSEELTSKAKVIVDQASKFAVEIGCAKEKRNAQTIYRPKFHLEAPNLRSINLEGSMTVNQGPRSSVRFNLKSDESNSAYLEGQVIYDRTGRNNAHYSTDVRGDLGFTVFRVNGEAKKADKILSAKTDIEYQIPRSRKHNIKVNGKIQNLSSSGLSKYANFVEVKSTQFPEKNFHLSWNLVHKEKEHYENEMTFMRDDSNSRVYLLQVSKFNGLKQGNVVTTQNVVVIEAAPLNINYEVKANGQIERDDTPKFRVAVTARNKRTGKESKGNLEYKYENRKPLKLSVGAALKLPSVDMSYNDRLEEVSPNTYKGQTRVRWGQNNHASLDYSYKYKKENQKTHRQIDTQFQTQSMKIPTKHQALFRTGQNDVELKSRFEKDGKQIWEAHSFLSNKGSSYMNIDTRAVSGRIEADPFSPNKAARVEVNGKSFDLTHQTSLSANSNAVSLNSVTTRKQRSVRVNSRISKHDKSQIEVQTESFSARLDANPSATPMTASVEIKSKHSQCSHSTNLAYQPGQASLKSKTVHKGENLLNIESLFAPRSKSYAHIDTRNYKLMGTAQNNKDKKTAAIEFRDLRNQYTHSSEASYDSSSFRMSCKNRDKDQEVLSLEATIDPKRTSKVDFENHHFSGSVNLDKQNKKAEVNVEDKLHSAKHRSTISARGGEYSLTSTTKKGSKTILVNGSANSKQMDATVTTNDYKRNLNVNFWSKGRLEVRSQSGKGVSHLSSYKIEAGTLNFNSKTEKGGKTLAQAEGKVNQKERSYVKVRSQKMTANAAYDPSGMSKKLEIEAQDNTRNLSHKTSVDYQPRNSIRVDSRTNKNGSNILLVNANVQSNSQRKQANFAVDYRSSIRHRTQATYEPKQAMTLSSSTQKDGQNILKINAESQKNSKSSIDIETTSARASLNCEKNGPKRSIQLNAQRLDNSMTHKTRIECETRKKIEIKSVTQRRGQTAARVESKLSRSEPSYLKVNTQSINAEASYDPSSPTKKAKVTFQDQRSKVHHSTQVHYDSDSVSLSSSHKENNRDVARLNSHFSRNQKSNINLQTSDWNGNLEVDPFSSSKSALFQLTSPSRRIAHSSQAQFHKNDGLKFQSNTNQNSQSLFEIDSHISPNKRSHFNLNSADHSSHFETNPFDDFKTVKFNHNNRKSGSNFDLGADYETGRFNLRSKRSQKDKTEAEFNARLSNRDESSRIYGQYGDYEAGFEVDPFGNSRSFSAKGKTPNHRLSHSSEYNQDDEEFNFKSSSSYQDNELYNFDTKIRNRGKSSARLNTQSHQTSIEGENSRNQKALTLYYKNKDTQRQVKASVDADTESKMNIEAKLEWDTDRHPEKRASLSAKIDGDRSQGKRSVSMTAEYKKHKAELNSESLAKNSQEAYKIDMSLKHPDKPTRSVSFRHESKKDQMNCDIKYSEDNKEKLRLSSFVNKDKSQNSMKLKGQVSARINNKDKRLAWDHQHSSQRDQAQMSTSLKAQSSSDQKYSVKVDAEKKTNKNGKTEVSAKFDAQSPVRNLEQVSGQVNAEYNKKGGKFTGEAKVHGNKKVKVTSEFKREGRTKEASITVDSDLDELIPDLKAQVSLTNERKRKEVKVDAESNGKKLAEFEANLNIEDRKSYNADFKVDSDFCSKYEVRVKSSAKNNNYNYEVETKKDNAQLFDAQVRAQTQHKTTAQASIRVKASEVLFVNLDNPEKDRYELTCRGAGAHARATYNAKDQHNESTQDVELCVSKTSCYTLQSKTKNLRSGRLDKGQVLTIDLEDKQTAQAYRLDYRLKTSDGFHAKLVADINGKKVGCDLTAQSSKDEKKVTGNAYLFDHVSKVRARKENQGKDRTKYTLELDPNSSTNENRVNVEVNKEERNDGSNRHATYDIKLSHAALTKPIKGKFEVKSRNSRDAKPYSAELELDLNQEPKKKLYAKVLIQNEHDNPKNKSISVHVYQQDNKQLDFGAKAHLAGDRHGASTGISWHWVNRKGQRKQGYNIIKANFDEKKITAVSASPLANLEAKGKYQNDKDEMKVEGELKVNGKARKAQASLDFKNEPCLEMSVQDENKNNKRQVEACVNVEKDRLLQVKVENRNNERITSDLLLAFDKRNGRSLKGSLQWNPESLVSLMNKLTKLWPSERASLGMKEVSKEMKHKSDMISEALESQALRPMKDSLAKEMKEMAEDIAQSAAVLKKALKKAIKNANFIPDVVEDAAKSAAERVAQALSKLASTSDLAERFVTEMEKRGIKKAANKAVNVLKQATKQAQKVVSSANGAINQMSEAATRKVARAAKKASLKVGELMEPVLENKMIKKAAQAAADAAEVAKKATNSVKKSVDNLKEAAKEAAKEALSNEDIRSIIKVIKSIIDEVIEELKKFDTKDIAELAREARNYALSPSAFLSQTRMLVYNPKQGEIEFEFSSPVKARSVQSMLNSFQSSQNYSNRIKQIRQSALGEWVPPFKAQALLVGGQHYVTFDGTTYDFAAPECTYLLTRDFKNGNFSAMVKYNDQTKDGEIKSSLVLKVNNRNIEIDNDNKQVKVNGNQVELPYTAGSVSMTRNGKAIELSDDSGLEVNCDLEYDVCSIKLAGWYFGKTKGLFGTYDYEDNNDMLLPRGEQASDSTELASNYQVDNSCQTRNIAKNQESQDNRAREACKKAFKDQSSPLSEGFDAIHPEDYYRMCLRHAEASKQHQNQQEAACTVAAAYATALKFQNIQVNMPNECLSCDDNEDGRERAYGSRSKVNVDKREADIVFVVEENDCNNKADEEIQNVAKLIERELESNGFRSVRFGVVAFGGSQDNGKRHSHTANGELLFNAQDVALATERMSHISNKDDDDDDDEVDAFEALAFASQYPFRPGASKNMILMSCTSCNDQDTRLDYTDIQQLLLSQGITLHTLNEKIIEVKSSGSKTRGIFAVDSRSVYVAKDHRSPDLEGQKDLRSHVNVPKDVCAALAQESNGSYFTTQPMSSEESKQWRSLLARRVAKTAHPHTCQKCDCVLDNDLIHSKTVCTPC